MGNPDFSKYSHIICRIVNIGIVLYGIDTRALTKHLREKGSMLGKIYFESPDEVEFDDPNAENLIAKVSCEAPEVHGDGEKTVVLVESRSKNKLKSGCVFWHTHFFYLLSKNIRFIGVICI